MHDARLLRSALRGNALFSLVSGLAFALAGGPIAHQVGLSEAAPVHALGVALLPFAFAVWTTAGRPGLSRTEGLVICGMDAGWVVGTAVLLAAWPELLNETGRWLAIDIALVVAGFAVWQAVGVRRLARAGATA